MAGRDAAKLDAVKRELAKVNPAVAAVPVIVADAFDAPALRSMAASASVVINVAGPCECCCCCVFVVCVVL
jgi:short subunit dehydrogenase-like uncharacterized protein